MADFRETVSERADLLVDAVRVRWRGIGKRHLER
jgi:hypothetical protein